MSDFYDDSRQTSTIDDAAAVPEPESGVEARTEPSSDPTMGGQPSVTRENQEPVEDAVEARFKSCRWYETQEAGSSYCSHRDVLPFAGKNGFNAKAWCPDCSFFKVKRTVKRRTASDYDDYN